MNYIRFILILSSSFFFSVSALEKFPLVSDLSLEQKVGQLLMAHFNGENVNEEAKKLIVQAHIGGIIYYNWANQLENPYQIYKLSQGLQALALESGTIPLFISTDQEGGKVNRLKHGFTLFPGNASLGQTHQPALARSSAIAMGQELSAVGINMVLGPVVDVNNNLNNPVIGIRSFGGDPKEVTHFAKQTLNGYRKVGMISVIKHFPGHGDTEVDSHEKIPVLKHSRKYLDEIELFPFNQLNNCADVMMTAHLNVPALDDENPITFSRKAIEGVLRKEWKYEGLIMTDSLVMQGIVEACPSIEEAAIRSIEAGHDIVLLGGKQLIDSQKGYELSSNDVLRIHQAIVSAVQSGRLSEERINASVKRILRLKEQNPLVQFPDFIKAALLVNTPENQQLAKEIAEKSVKIASRQQILSLDMENSKVAIIASDLVKDQIEKTTLQKMGRENSSLFFSKANPNELEVQQASELASWANIIFVCSLDAWKNKQQANLIHKLQSFNKQIVIFVIGNPQDALLYSNAEAVIWTFSPVHYSIQAALDLLLKGLHE